MSALDDFKKDKRFAVCVDSDGCAMDTMNIKHFRCFGPCMVEEWRLEPRPLNPRPPEFYASFFFLPTRNAHHRS